MKWHNAHQVWASRSDRESQNAERSARYQADIETERAKRREKRKANPAAARARDSAEYRNNKPAHAARTKAYRAQHPEIRAKEYKNARQRYPWKKALINAAHRAGKKDFPFDLTKDWCAERWNGKCELSGISFVLGNQTHFSLAPSIDRVDSAKGYTQDNCRFILFALNSFKGVGTDEQMFEIAKSLLLHQKLAPCKL